MYKFILSDRDPLNPIEDCMVGVRRSPLRGHMTRTMNRGKGKLTVLTGLNIAANLAINVVLSPGILNWPVFILNPTLGTIGADNHVSVS